MTRRGRGPVLGLLLVLAACGDGSVSAQQQAESAADVDALCEDAGMQWDGQVVGAYPSTVEDVRQYVSDPHAADGEAAAPAPGPGAVPADWTALAADEPAAVCYLDGAVPKGPPPAADGTSRPSFDRRLVVAAEAARPFMVSAGYQDSMPAEPLPER